MHRVLIKRKQWNENKVCPTAVTIRDDLLHISVIPEPLTYQNVDY